MYRATRTVLGSNSFLFLAGAVAFVALWQFLLRYHPLDRISTGVLVWWSGLCAASICNIGLWWLSANALVRRKDTADPDLYLFQRRQLLLAAVYVFGCAFRSILPRADVQRIGLLDSWVSSVMLGRSVATVAELCFVAQWALLLNRLARDANARPALVISWLVVPLIAIAEICSWYGVLTTSCIGNAVEESIWAFVALLVVVGFVTLWPRCPATYRPFLAVAVALGVAYVLFMCTVDVPMYISRWLADEANGREYLSLGQGFRDVGSRWTVTLAWEAWQMEIPWMSLYFTVGVWCSIALVHTPRLELKGTQTDCLRSASRATT